MKNILFYSPFMGINGAEMMIKNIVSSVKQINPILLSGEKGALLPELNERIPVFIHAYASRWKYIYGKFAKKLSFPDLSEIQFKNILKKHQIDLIVVNTIIANKIIPLLKKYAVPFVLYAHELPPMFDLISKDDLEYLIKNAIGIIGCSSQVCNNFKLMGASNVRLFYSSINIKGIKTSEETEKKVKSKNFSFLFVMSGYRCSPKGYYLVTEIADFLIKYNAALVWVGSPSDDGLDYYIQKLIETKSLKNVLLPGLLKKEEYYSWLNACDAFLLTSLFDSYPLVMLEAAYLQKPIIAFKSGGSSEFIKEGMGKIVPYYCLDAYLETIKDFIEGKILVDKELLRKEAERHDISKTIDEFENILFQFLTYHSYSIHTLSWKKDT